MGSLVGILPGGGAGSSSVAASTCEQKIAKDPSRFGRGAIQGVAAPVRRLRSPQSVRSSPAVPQRC